MDMNHIKKMTKFTWEQISKKSKSINIKNSKEANTYFFALLSINFPLN